jgi:glycosyltransferase involved in cell wall biosynthesis
MRISVGIPVYDGKLPVALAHSLLTENSIASAMGDELVVNFLPSCTNLAFGRNQIVKEFMKTGNDRLVFVDADVTFEPGALIKLAHYPVDFVGAAYRMKLEKEEYPVCFLKNKIQIEEKFGLIEVAMVPTGMLSLSRRVFTNFMEAYPGRDYASRGSTPTYCFFQIPYKEGLGLYTEDSYFCKEWTEMGGKIYLDPENNMTHWNGNIPFTGNIGNWLRSRVQKESA